MPIDETDAGSSGDARSPLISVGTSDAAELLAYRFSDTTPTYCQTPEGVLDAIVARIDAVGGPCHAQKSIAATAGEVTLVIRCDIKDTGNCTEIYVGHVWIDRDPNSLSDFSVLAQGHTRRSCGSTGVFPASEEFREQVARSSDQLEDVLKPCRQETTP